MSSERKEIITLVNEACVSGARQSNACECIGISAKTLSIEDIDAPLFKSRATIQDGYLKVVSYATEFNEKRGVYATNYNLRRS
jgi:hypothetical protein